MTVAAQQTIYVAAYEFPPYFSEKTENHLSGQLIAALNSEQDEYEFVLQRVAPNARYDALSEDGCCSLILFEDKKWGWADKADYTVATTQPIKIGHERFVALKQPGRDQSFFAQTGLKFGGLVGYHYPFAGNITDNGVLENEYGIYLSHSHSTNLKMLLNKRLDLVMLHDDYIDTMIPAETQEQLLIAKEHYDRFELAVVVNEKKGLAASKIEQLLERINLKELVTRY
ncbi:amino acid ABC transporter substrate-binding protein [Pseudidiomarina aestuarii]|uniref:Amino acid ABC transporter substrate-binding protein n=1 Tax=Pseudidiomarina aestuarii TaxID=624146 RepID=A0A7Z6ZUV8_9GAMM|nr:amino acid ABC transporter substrate-binding protein [Pseudidiomarina aestuarii]RUO41849.1 amino acid ABC transporter substrate-binding protein [Pseudidiomarina aestuarii]